TTISASPIAARHCATTVAMAAASLKQGMATATRANSGGDPWVKLKRRAGNGSRQSGVGWESTHSRNGRDVLKNLLTPASRRKLLTSFFPKSFVFPLKNTLSSAGFDRAW